jgi:hypothetical protein
MGASTNAPRIFVGTAGTKICYFKRQLDNNPNAIKITLDEVFAQRLDMFNETGDESHLLYKKFVDYEISHDPLGKDSDYIQTQYFGRWVIGSGQFTTVEELDALIGSYRIQDENRDYEEGEGKNKKKYDALPCFVGVDTAKYPDRTVVTVIRNKQGDEAKSQLLGWLSLQGDNYEDQFDYICNYLLRFESIFKIAIDATGQADFMPDKFERHTYYDILRVKFSAETKDNIYKILMQVMKNKLTEIPNDPHSADYMRFRQELLDLEKEYKGRFLSVHHPEGKDMHDDYPDSWALAEYAKTEYEKKSPRIS